MYMEKKNKLINLKTRHYAKAKVKGVEPIFNK